MSKISIALLASHEGSLMQGVIDACEDGRLAAGISLVISNNSESGALRRARSQGIRAIHMSRATHADEQKLDAAMAEALQEHGIDLVVLAGYMRLIGPVTLLEFSGRVINCHPSLLPKYGGQGYFGRRVHQAVLDAGETETGSTIHFVDEIYDHGAIICQNRVEVLPSDTAQTLESRVKAAEHQLLINAIGLVLDS